MVSASIFDLDGTLVLKDKWLMANFSRYLSSKNIFPKNSQSEIEKIKEMYFQNKIGYREMALELPNAYSVALKGIKEDDVKSVAEKFVKNEVIEGYFYPFTEGLTKLMKRHGITIGISGAPKEVVLPIGEHLKFDLSFGTELETKSGVYTGRLKQNLIIREAKEAVLEKIIKENKIDLDTSYAFGDTEQDVSVLSRVGNPVALNPNENLLTIAKKNNWMIFYPEDNIISRIRKKLDN
jgi:HAD superfamily hydrolase (TIGR01490 family)